MGKIAYCFYADSSVFFFVFVLQPLRLDIKRVLSARSDRVKSVDLHPTEPWILVSLYNGHVNIWSYESGTGEVKSPIKTIEVCDLPVRAAVFIARKHWIVTGSDDMKVLPKRA